MKEISERKLNFIVGGISTWGIIGIIAGAVFSIGFVDGLVRPLKCR